VNGSESDPWCMVQAPVMGWRGKSGAHGVCVDVEVVAMATMFVSSIYSNHRVRKRCNVCGTKSF
jgi:hypothetical protein